MKVKMILPALTEATSPFWRPIKYSLFPPLGLATLAAYLRDDDVTLQDEHVCLGRQPSDMSHFVTVIHDLTPCHWASIAAITRQLEPLVGNNLSGAVIPCWQGQPLSKFERGFCDFVRGTFGDILLHGYAHRCDGNGGWAGLLTGRLNEFTGLPESEAIERLRRGQNILAEAFGRTAAGFVPPAWQWGALTPRSLSACGLKYGVGLAGIYDLHGGHAPLATWSWDNGRFAPLGYVGEAGGWLMSVMSADSLPCIVFHPADVGRGFVPHGLRLIQRLLAEGRQPASFAKMCPTQSLDDVLS